MRTATREFEPISASSSFLPDDFTNIDPQLLARLVADTEPESDIDSTSDTDSASDSDEYPEMYKRAVRGKRN